MGEKGEDSVPSTIVIVAALNEEEGIGPTLTEIKNFLDESLCLVVDGRSKNGTAKIAELMGAQVIPQKGSGKGDAIATAIEHLKNLNAKYVAFIDADYSYPAEYLPQMLNILEENPDVGMVCGNRFNEHLHLEAMRNMFYLGNRLLAFTHNFLNGVDLLDPLTGLRVVRWKIVKHWKPRSKGFDVEVELNHLVEKKGYRIFEIPIHYRPRLGEKKLKLRHGFTILKRILLESI
ncbi:MAG: glycosyltransferase family 2 protein [Candidatus Bathyarchaeia archaeon]